MAEFDDYVESYINEVNESIKISGGSLHYFAEYKVSKMKDWLSKINGISTKNILDFGSGLGLAEVYFEKYFPESKLYGVDISEKSIGYAKKLSLNNSEFYVYDGNKIPFENDRFDIIFSAGTFHHISPDKHLELMKEIRRVLSPNGIFFLFELNRINPLVRYMSYKSRFDVNADLLYPGNVNRKLKKAGFSNIQLKFIIFFPKLLNRLLFLESYLTKVPIGAQYCFILKK